MVDVRSLLKNERAARRIQHKYASYSPGGGLSCAACHLQLKSESLWNGHLRSPGHIMRAQRLEEEKVHDNGLDEPTQSEVATKKRKASHDEDANTRKRNKPMNGTPEGFHDAVQTPVEARAVRPSPTSEFQIPSRPATPLKPPQEVTKPVEVDEDEWAAFEADIASAEVPATTADAVISAPAMTAAEVAQKSVDESNAQKRERQEAELEGEKEDAARKLEEQLEEMEGLEQRVKRLREKREELRKKESKVELRIPQNASIAQPTTNLVEEESDEDEDEDEDDWDGFE